MPCESYESFIQNSTSINSKSFFLSLQFFLRVVDRITRYEFNDDDLKFLGCVRPVTCLLSLDPGSDKCGYAIIRYDLVVEEKGVVLFGDLSKTMKRLQKFHPEVVVVGKGTASKVVFDLLKDLNLGIEIRYGDECNTTYEARKRYFKDNPPTGLWRLVPLGMQFPPRPIDDYAAILIGERYLHEHHLYHEGK